MVTVLALETSAGACSAAALGADGAVLAHRRVVAARGHAEILLPMVGAVLAAAGLDWPALDLLAVTTGPGTFTGIRIGLAAARGLALASGLPLLGVTSFDAIASEAAPEPCGGRKLLVAIDSRRGDIFAQLFDASGGTLGAAAAMAPADLVRLVPPGELVIAGDGAAAAAASLAAAGRSVVLAAVVGPPDAIAVARLAQARWRPGRAPAPVEPTYLRPPDATLPPAPAATP